jgi:hypothetical protein
MEAESIIDVIQMVWQGDTDANDMPQNHRIVS